MTRVLRVIARMNVGGPAHHVSLLSGRRAPERFETLLVHGNVGRGEASFEELARREGCRVAPARHLSPEIDLLADGRALGELVRIVRRFRPHIVHTHTAKAGFLGRQAALLAGRRRPLIVHTYHGHVLEGYFGPAKSALYRSLERALARVSDRLIGVSSATVDDLVRLGVAPRSRFRVVPLGLDLARFVAPDPLAVRAFRERAAVRDGELLLTYVGRLVPIKRVDVALRALATLRADGLPVRLAVVGDGESRAELEVLAGRLGVADAAPFLGYVEDSAPAAAAADLALLSSDNEGTPVSLIEAGAAGRASVATAVGGVADVVQADTGALVPAGDHEALATATARLVSDPATRLEMGRRARQHVLARFSAERLLRDVAQLYDELVA